jgi:hypothetical protein
MLIKPCARIFSVFKMLLLASLLLTLEVASIARADLLSGSNMVLMRGGDANAPQGTFGGGEVPAYLDGYSVSVSGGLATATYVGSYAIPTATLTLPGITAASHEGRLELSGNGQYLDFGGYAQPISSSTPRLISGAGGIGYLRVGQVSAAGTFVSAGLDTGATNPQFIRGAYSNDGTQAWVASKNPNGGLEYVSGIGGSPTTTQLQTTTDWRDLKVNSGQLYGGTGSSSVGTHGFYSIGTGAPTSGTPANTLLTNSSDNATSGFAFASLPGGTPPTNGISGGPNVAYIVGDPSGNNYIGKLYNDGTTSNLVFAGGARLGLGTSVPTPEGIVAKVDPDNSAWVDLFIQNADGIYFAVDKTGTSNGSISGLSFTKIIGTGSVPLQTGGALYGISTAPRVVPEPGSLILSVLAAVVGLGVTPKRRSKS